MTQWTPIYRDGKETRDDSGRDRVAEWQGSSFGSGLSDLNPRLRHYSSYGVNMDLDQSHLVGEELRGWLARRASIAEQDLRQRPIDRLGPAAKILLGCAEASTIFEASAPLDLSAKSGPPVLHVLTSDGAAGDPFAGQLPLMMIVAEDER